VLILKAELFLRATAILLIPLTALQYVQTAEQTASVSTSSAQRPLTLDWESKSDC
jgi:hypothetical protein